MSDAGRVALITGAGRGIGAATATLLAERGWRVAALDLQHEHPLASPPGTGELVQLDADVTDEESLGLAVMSVVDRFGQIDGVFANAALMPYGTVLDTSPDQWRRILEVNLTGVFLTIRLCLPSMIEHGGGVILATSSDAAIRTTRKTAGYVTSKHGVIGLVRSVAVDYGRQGIRANVLVPGVTDTPGVREVYSTPGQTVEDSLAKAAELSPLGRTAVPDDIARTAAFLLSDEARFITGASVVVDGGMTVTYGAD